MSELIEKPEIDFSTYPSVGQEDWNYVFASAKVRSLETTMLTKATLQDMANAATYDQAVDLLSSSEYAMPQSGRNFEQLSAMLLEKRSDVRTLFKSLINNKELADLIMARDDFANLRLALRRKLTDKPIGTDYSNDGCIAAEFLEQIFEEENYAPLPMHMQEAIEEAVLAYYQNKDIRQIDYAVDRYEITDGIETAEHIGSVFMREIFRMKADLTNIRTMLRLKFTACDNRNVFLPGGYIEIEKLKHCLDLSYEAVPPLFYATPYFGVVESGVHYLIANNSFLKLESNCQKHLEGYLRSAWQITAGTQPVIAYLLLKEAEIRDVRLILTAKINQLDKKLIIDGLGI